MEVHIVVVMASGVQARDLLAGARVSTRSIRPSRTWWSTRFRSADATFAKAGRPEVWEARPRRDSGGNQVVDLVDRR